MSNLQEQDPVPQGDTVPTQDKPDEDVKPDQKTENTEPLKGDESDAQIANKLISIIDSANERILPLTGKFTLPHANEGVSNEIL